MVCRRAHDARAAFSGLGGARRDTTLEAFDFVAVGRAAEEWVGCHQRGPRIRSKAKRVDMSSAGGISVCVSIRSMQDDERETHTMY